MDIVMKQWGRGHTHRGAREVLLEKMAFKLEPSDGHGDSFLSRRKSKCKGPGVRGAWLVLVGTHVWLEISVSRRKGYGRRFIRCGWCLYFILRTMGSHWRVLSMCPSPAQGAVNQDHHLDLSVNLNSITTV